METSQNAWNFDATLGEASLEPLTRGSVKTLQINVGKRCNQACRHCHVDAGPQRTEEMGSLVAEQTLKLLAASPSVEVVDFTGGAPELNPHFRWMVQKTRELNRHVLTRCNLSVLFEPGMEDMPAFFAENRLQVVASLPCYGSKNVDEQRGRGVFDKSIRALRLLNDLGYGRPDSGLELNLVYNPGGPFLPPAQGALEQDYRRELSNGFQVVFNRLLTLTNLPIKRFAHQLNREGKYAEYMSLLVDNFNAQTVAELMCLSLVSVGWDGRLFDCDFNQMLAMPVPSTPGPTGSVGRDSTTGNLTVWDLQSLDELVGQKVATASHCFGCTAGAGSSCGGALL
ncbi:MAG: radical SAM/Cys-rich domain protein [Proteobacteria bacterium]|jgi:radical SAM/Cys-rich protein|nr:radical SAM/Cys-rich domain protein [Pseudomonadota bacterium]